MPSWLVNSSIAEMSDIELSASRSFVRLINAAIGEISDIELLLIKLLAMISPPRSRVFRLVAASRPVTSLMSVLLALSSVNVAMSATVMMAPGAIPRCFSMATRRLGSGISTICAVDVNGMERKINRKNMRRKDCFVMNLSSLGLEIHAKNEGAMVVGKGKAATPPTRN